jgi:hypothetical protein
MHSYARSRVCGVASPRVSQVVKPRHLRTISHEGSCQLRNSAYALMSLSHSGRNRFFVGRRSHWKDRACADQTADADEILYSTWFMIHQPARSVTPAVFTSQKQSSSPYLYDLYHDNAQRPSYWRRRRVVERLPCCPLPSSLPGAHRPSRCHVFRKWRLVSSATRLAGASAGA